MCYSCLHYVWFRAVICARSCKLGCFSFDTGCVTLVYFMFDSELLSVREVVNRGCFCFDTGCVTLVYIMFGSELLAAQEVTVFRFALIRDILFTLRVAVASCCPLEK